MKPSYTPGFLKCWKAYPHYGQRSKKREAARVWTGYSLEPQTERVLLWIEAGKRCDQWNRDDGQYVPGFQAYLRAHDFEDDPPREPGHDKASPARDETPLERLRAAVWAVTDGQEIPRNKASMAAYEAYSASQAATVEDVLARLGRDNSEGLTH